MLFHEDKLEQLYDYILNHVFTKFDGKTIGSEGCTIEDIKKSLPCYIDDDSSEDEYENATDAREEPVADMQNISESSDDDDETDDLEQGKKEEEPEIISDPSDEPCPEPKEEESKEPVKNDEPVVDTKPFTDSIQDEEPKKPKKEKKKKKPKKEKVEKDKKPKKEKVEKDKKPKKEKSDKPSKPQSSFLYFKSHPDNQDLINEAAKQPQGEDGKNPGNPIGKVSGAGVVWKTVSEEDKEVWKQRAIDAFNQLNQ